METKGTMRRPLLTLGTRAAAILLVSILGLSKRVFSFLTTRQTTDRGPRNIKQRALEAVAASADSCDVFGGGFGGLYTALGIARQAKRQGIKNLDIALVDPGTGFVFLPLLYDLTMETATETEVCPLYRDLLAGSGVRHIRASLDSFASLDCRTASLNLQRDQQQQLLSFSATVVSVGATPSTVISSVPGALECVQPFYTLPHARQTRQMLNSLEATASAPRVAVIGGGYGGVELSACVKRRLGPNSHVSLLSRGAPMKGTRAEPLVNQALENLGVEVEVCEVESFQKVEQDDAPMNAFSKRYPRVHIARRAMEDATVSDAADAANGSEVWDAVLWTAGSSPEYPVSSDGDNMAGLARVPSSGRLAVDATLRCMWDAKQNTEFGRRMQRPTVWAVGDCAEVQYYGSQPAVPRTAQAAMQQADVVTSNILTYLQAGRRRSSPRYETFRYQDLGTVLSLGGPNAAALGPSEGAALAPIFVPFLDTARAGLEVADDWIGGRLRDSGLSEQAGVSRDIAASSGISLGGYGLGVNATSAPSGTLTGTMAGAVRRALYAARMPTNRQRAFAATSAVLSTASALAKEAAEQIQQLNRVDKSD